MQSTLVKFLDNYKDISEEKEGTNLITRAQSGDKFVSKEMQSTAFNHEFTVFSVYH